MKGTLSSGALAWLGDVISGRFGAKCALTRIDERQVALTCAGEPGGIVFTVTEPRFHGDGRSLPLAWWDPRSAGLIPLLELPLPLIGAHGDVAALVEPHDDGIRLHVDLPGLLYWCLARVEEVGRHDLDRYDRFPAAASHAGRHRYLDRPIVDEWLDALHQLCRRQWAGLPASTAARTFRIAPSHDVDLPSRYAMRTFRGYASAVLDDLRDLSPARALAGVARRLSRPNAIGARDPANTFDWLMDRSERVNVRSAFYFICGRTNARMDAGYDIGQPAMRALLRRIHGRGHEIGLHPSFETYLDPVQLGREADHLRTVCAEEGIEQEHWGGRMHYLRWQTPTTLRAWEGAGMRYDSTLGYADCAGFRCGTCHEYPAFDPVAGRAVNLRIRPLVAMEVTIMSSAYMALGTGPGALAELAKLKERCRRVGGTFSLLWHNSELTQAAQRALYDAALAV